MNISRTKNISLDEECVKIMESLVKKHQGNFSAAIRELIIRSEKFLPDNTTAIDESLFGWMLDEIDGRLIPDNILNRIIDPSLVNNLNNLERYINQRIKDFEWGINIDIKCDNITYPSNILIEITGNGYNKIRFVASILTQFIVKNSSESSPFNIRYIANIGNGVKVELYRCTNKKEAINSLMIFFGRMEDIAKATKSRTSFWKCIVNRHVLSSYQMITVHRNYYEDILAGKVPMGEIMIETIAKKPIQEICLKEMLGLIKQVYEASRVVDKVDIRNDNMVLFHNYRNKDAIEKIKKQLIMLLETNGHLYDAKSTTNMIILEHRPEIGIKINEIVNNLKTSGGKLDEELIMFLSFLKGLQHMPDTPMSVALLGRRIGKTLLQEYEKENNIKGWNLEIFKTAFETIDSKIHRESEWKLENKSLLYRIRKCSITMEGDTFDAYICRTAREAFKGALDYAFGSRAELEIKKLITHGDNICEVSIQIKDVDQKRLA